MQATLLGIAFALILALVAALVGPLFFPWNDYRAAFEAEASRLTGLPLRITGTIDARILPTPKLTLKGVELVSGDSNATDKLRVGDVRVEFALAPMLRGERKVSELRIDGPDLSAGLDASGRIVGLPVLGKTDPDQVSIEKLTVENGSLTVTGAIGGASLALERFEFTGDMRSLAGPLKGEGSFVLAGQHYPYRIGTGRVGDDGTMRLKLTVDPIGRPMAEADGALSMANGMPRFEGNVTLARGVELARTEGRSVVSEPWRVSSRVRGGGGGAVLEQVELQYGPEERAIKLRGDARVTFGARPRIEGVLSAPTIDLDRALGLPDESRRKPLAVIKGLGGYFAGGQKLPIPVKLGISAESVTFAGALLQKVSGDVTLEAESWDIEQLEFRAPGFTQMRMSGRLSGTAAGASFSGPVKIDANDPRAFIAWITDRNDLQPTSVEPLRLAGDVTIGNGTIGVEHLDAELDRVSVQGRFAYHWADGDKPARFDAALSAPELDVDRAASVLAAAVSDTRFDWPREGNLAFEVGRATVAGVDARDASGKMWLDRSGFMVERLSIGDLGGAAVSGSGRIDTAGAAPRGTMSFELDAKRLDGTTALVERLSPRIADLMRRAAGRVSSGKLNATLSLDDPPAKAAGTLARFTLDGRIGEIKLMLNGGATTEVATLAQVFDSRPAMRLNVKAEAEDAGVLVGFLGLERVVTAERRPGQLTINAVGPLGGELVIDAAVSGAGFDARADGTARLLLDDGPRATLRLDVANADLRALRPGSGARNPLPARLKGRLVLNGGSAAIDQIAGSIAGTALRGRLSYDFAGGRTIGGDIEVDAVDLPMLAGALAGLPSQANAATWSSEPFTAAALAGGALTGRIAVRSARATLTPKLSVENLRGTLTIAGTDIALDDIEGTLAGGRVSGQLALHRAAAGVTGRATVSIVDASAPALLPAAKQAITGKLSLDIGLEGTGLSPAALMGSLGGTASFKLEDAVIPGIDPRAFDMVIRAVDQGLALERIGHRAEQVMGPGKLAVQRAEGTLTILGGQARLGVTTVRAQGAELSVSGGVNLAAETLDIRMAMVSPALTSEIRPEIVINLKGPLDAPQRSLDMSSFASWLALRAVEQQAKRLDAIQATRNDPALTVPSTPANPAATPSQPVAVPPPSTPAQAAPAPGETVATTPAVPPAAAPSVTPMPVPAPPVRAAPAAPVPPPPAAQAAPSPAPPRPSAPRAVPALPPPIDIRPAPVPRPQADIPRADMTAR